MFFISLFLHLAVVYAVASLLYTLVQIVLNRNIDWRIFTIDKFGYMMVILLFMGFGYMVYADYKHEDEHEKHGIKVGSVTDIQYVNGGINNESGDNSYYKVFIINDLSDREEVWGAGSKDVNKLYIGKEVKLDTTSMSYLTTIKKPEYVQKAKR